MTSAMSRRYHVFVYKSKWPRGAVASAQAWWASRVQLMQQGEKTFESANQATKLVTNLPCSQ